MEPLVWKHCYTCLDYAQERRDVIAGPLGAKAHREGRNAFEVVDEFMLAAHERHVSTGEPLRPGGPTRVTNPNAGRLMATYMMIGSRL